MVAGKKRSSYVPQRGDVVWLQFNPQAGHEQAGLRPALILSSQKYNSRVGLALCCPITSHSKGFPFEVALSPKAKINGVVLADQIKSVDWRARKAQKCDVISEDAMSEVLAKIAALLADD